MQHNTQVPVGKHNNRQHASPHHEVATDVKQMPIRPIIIIICLFGRNYFENRNCIKHRMFVQAYSPQFCTGSFNICLFKKYVYLFDKHLLNKWSLLIKYHCTYDTYCFYAIMSSIIPDKQTILMCYHMMGQMSYESYCTAHSVWCITGLGARSRNLG